MRLRRHGKALLGDLEGDLTWITHLGMSGRLSVDDPATPEPAHTNISLTLSGGRVVRFVDPRTFGYMAVLTPEELAAFPVSRWGRDALTDLPRSSVLADSLGRRQAPIKAVLLDQRVLAGIGNIYADEVLYRARVHPATPARDLTPRQVQAVRRAIRPVLEAGLRHGGTSLDDLAYLLPDGRAGTYLARLAAYGREGEPCRRCRTPIERSIVGQRASFWCPACQAPSRS